jgi:hypothetical protein
MPEKEEDEDEDEDEIFEFPLSETSSSHPS